MNLIDHAKMYFQAFASKDISHLSQQLDAEVSLRDWEIRVLGRDAVLFEMNKAFCTFESSGIRNAVDVELQS
jgi:hypothetical protein